MNLHAHRLLFYTNINGEVRCQVSRLYFHPRARERISTPITIYEPLGVFCAEASPRLKRNLAPSSSSRWWWILKSNYSFQQTSRRVTGVKMLSFCPVREGRDNYSVSLILFIFFNQENAFHLFSVERKKSRRVSPGYWFSCLPCKYANQSGLQGREEMTRKCWRPGDRIWKCALHATIH